MDTKMKPYTIHIKSTKRPKKKQRRNKKKINTNKKPEKENKNKENNTKENNDIKTKNKNKIPRQKQYSNTVSFVINPADKVTKETNINTEAQNKTKTNQKSKQKNKNKEISIKENKYNKTKNRNLSLNQKQHFETFGVTITPTKATNEKIDLNRVQHQRKIRKIIKQWNIMPKSTLCWNRVRDMLDRYWFNNTSNFKMNSRKFQKNQRKIIMVVSAGIFVNNANKAR